MKIVEFEIGNIRTIKFNENGLSIIKANKTLPDDTKKDKRSVNGSGKSLIIAFIHYCLGGFKELAKSLKLGTCRIYSICKINGYT